MSALAHEILDALAKGASQAAMGTYTGYHGGTDDSQAFYSRMGVIFSNAARLVEPPPVPPMPEQDNRPHSRSCGIRPHTHESGRCGKDCPTCVAVARVAVE